MNICIRVMQAIDIDAILNIEKQTSYIPWSMQSLKNDLNNQHAIYYVLDVEGIVVGYAGMWFILDEAHINNIAILHKYRNQGLGRLLLCKLIRYAKQHAVCSITLEVRKSNFIAKYLYEKFNFKIVGIRHKYYSNNKEDALIMGLYDLQL